MAAPKMTRHDMKQDDLVTVIEKTRSYVDRNPTLVRNIGIGAAAVLVLVGGFSYWRSSRKAAAADLGREAHARMAAPVVATNADPTNVSAPSYPTEADRDKAALESYTTLATRYGSSPEGRVALYYQGVLLARTGRTQEAQAALEQFLDHSSSSLLTDLAKVQLAQIHGQNGDLDGAAKMFSEIAENKGAFPRDWALYYLASTQEKQGKRDEAAKTYATIVKEFPTSTFSAEATRKSRGA